MEQKSVFISYRRALSKHLARSVYQDLKMHGWDVFLDVSTIDSGDFDRIILNQIGARAHFILLISPGSLERCASPGDWVLREIEEAVRLERNIVPVIEEGVDFSREMAYLPEGLRDIISRKNALPLPHFFFDAAVEMLRTRFLKTPEYVTITTPPAAEQVEAQRRMEEVDAALPAVPPVNPSPAKPPARAKPRSADILPAPFAWIEIPGKGYSIAKYPVTNAHFAKFIEAGGYQERRWWTDAGWAQREKDGWTEPRLWKDSKWNGAEQPVVGVSWYEALAFYLWLSELTGEQIMLPTEAQWIYAAQGDDGRVYPWGDKWDCKRCNNGVSPCKSYRTTPVRQYDGAGDSPFGVVDMAGNVREWCLTAYETGSQDINGTDGRVVRGGSWNDSITNWFRCDDRVRYGPHIRSEVNGFRLSRS